ncbi:hypothetical protein WA538_000890, partial [Blastocystis sp. DL]
DDSKKLKFVEKNKVVNTPDDDWAGLRTSSEYAQLLEEKKRRRELGRYQLPSNEIEEVIAYERNKPANREDDLASLPTRLCRIYAKIEVLRRKYEDSERLQLLEESAREKPLSVTLDREVDELLSLHRLHTPQARFHSEQSQAKENSGVVIMHLPPRQDPSVLLRKLDEDFVRRNPLVREEVFGDGNEGNGDKRSNDMDNKQFNDMDNKQVSEMDNKNTSNHSTNHPHTPNNSSPKRIRITNDSPLSSLSYASDEEMNTLPQMKKYVKGEPNRILFIRNLPKSISCEELVSLCAPFHFHQPMFTLLTGRMKGQAFVELDDVEAAEAALQSLHKLVYHTKPLIVSYKRV